MSRFTRREALAMYGVLFGCSLGFFLLGVYAGRSFFPEPPAAPVGKVEPVKLPEVQQELDFYNDLVPSAPGGAGGAAAANVAGAETSSTEPSASAGTAPPPPAKAGEPPAETGPATPAQRDDGGQPSRRFMTVQAGAYNTAPEARQLTIRLEAKGYSARVVEPPPGKRDYYRVWVGEFEDEAAARKIEERLKADGFPTFLKWVEEPPRSN